MLFQLVQLAVSIAAVLLLALLAHQLGLGGDVRLRSEAQARDEAKAQLGGFDAVEVAIDRAGIGALLRDGQGRVLLLRRHGAQFAARLLDSHSDTRLHQNFLTIGTSDPSFGKITIDLGDRAQVWAASLRRLGA